MKEDDWTILNYKFTRNFPANELEESQIAGNLTGVTSHETQLKVLSIVDDVQAELDRIKEEQDEGYDTEYATNRTVETVEVVTDDEEGQQLLAEAPTGTE